MDFGLGLVGADVYIQNIENIMLKDTLILGRDPWDVGWYGSRILAREKLGC